MRKILSYLALLLFLSSNVEAATTYYVATTGNDSNAGTIGNPWKNPQRCTSSPVAAGDTCSVGDGTYTDLDNNGIVVYITSSSAQGSSNNPITIKSTNPLGAKLIVPGVNAANAGFYLSNANWYIIEGFDISGGTGTGASASNHGVYIAGGSGHKVWKNTIHNIGRTLCYNTANGNTGVFVGNPSASNIVITQNDIHTVGRLRNGESGCVTNIYQHDHAIYLHDVATITVTRNLCYDSNRGFCLQFSGGTVSNALVCNNTWVGHSLAANGLPSGQVILSGIITTATIKNNLSYSPSSAGTFNDFQVSAFNVTVDYTLTDNADANTFVNSPPSGVTVGSHNLVGNNLINFVSAGSDNYTLDNGSSAINAGVDVGIAFNGIAPDIGAFEVPRFSVCSGVGALLTVTFSNNLNPPLIPSSSINGFTARKNLANNTLTSGTISGTNMVNFTMTNPVGGGDTLDISFTPSNLTASDAIGGILNQRVNLITNQSCSIGAGTFTLTETIFRWNGLRGTEAAPVSTPYASAPASTNIFVVPGGSARLRIGISCTGAACPAIGFALQINKNSTAWSALPDTFGSAKVAFCGTSPDPDIPTSGTFTTQQLAGSGTFAPGALVRTSNAIPNITMVAGGRTEVEWCVTWAANASPTDTYDFRAVQQDGTVLTYNVTPRAIITGSQFGAGF